MEKMTNEDKRFRIATSALNGHLANPSWEDSSLSFAVGRAILAADLLLASLVDDGPQEIEGTITETGRYPEGTFVTVRIPPGKFSDDILGRTVKISFEREEK